MLEFMAFAFVLGVGATAFLDCWSLYQARAFAARPLDYGLVGRWFAHLVRGRFRHDGIAQSPPVTGERTLGWIVHYGSGVGFAALFLFLAGSEWLHSPRLLPALGFGVATILFPFLLMQPGMGLGVAAAKTADPTAARLRSLLTHILFGCGLFLAGTLIDWSVGEVASLVDPCIVPASF
jgi:hypothetical protein